MTLRTSNQLFDAYFTADSMAEVFCDEGRLQGMLDFEAGLARAQAQVGLIPPSAVAPCCGESDWAVRPPPLPPDWPPAPVRQHPPRRSARPAAPRRPPPRAARSTPPASTAAWPRCPASSTAT